MGTTPLVLPKAVLEGAGHAIGKDFANQLGHSHEGDNNHMYVTPDQNPPQMGPLNPNRQHPLITT